MFGLIALTLAVTTSVPTFTISYPQTLMGAFSGRIYLYITKSSGEQPRMMSDWDNLGPVVVMAVKNVKPDTDIAIDSNSVVGMTSAFDSLPAGQYSVQAVIDRNPNSSSVGDSDGNLYSNPIAFTVGGSSGSVKLTCDQVVMEPTVHVGRDVKVVELESTALSNAQRRSYIWRAVVVLPTEFATQPSRKFPVVLDIPDLGKSYTDYPNRDTNKTAYRDGKPVVYLRIDTDSPAGYHFFANSANTGPWATALEQEFLPYVEKQYRGDSNQVSLEGVGAGAWSALWLLANDPGAFTHVNATEPSSVDFHQFHGLNLYADENAFSDAQGSPRKWLRNGNQTWQQHAEVERALRGLQIAAWEADFSPKGKNNKPLPLFDRATGRIDPAVAKAWEAFDLNAYLKAKWPTVGTSLAGKATITLHTGDSSFDDESMQMLKTEVEGLGAKFSFPLITADFGHN